MRGCMCVLCGRVCVYGWLYEYISNLYYLYAHKISFSHLMQIRRDKCFVCTSPLFLVINT